MPLHLNRPRPTPSKPTLRRKLKAHERWMEKTDKVYGENDPEELNYTKPDAPTFKIGSKSIDTRNYAKGGVVR